MYKNEFVVCLKTKDGKILRDNNGVIKLPFGSEYSIYLKNLNNRKAKVEIAIDGEDVLDGNSIIVDGNNISEIKGFLKGDKAKNSFKFIEKIKEISEYRGDKIDDGLVRVKVTYEKGKVEIPYYTLQDNWFKPCVQPRVTYSTHTNTQEVKSIFRSCDISPQSCASLDNVEIGSIENTDGITVHGQPIYQGFEKSSIGQLEKNSTIIVLKLTGYKESNKKVDKPITVKTKNQCPTCGKMCKSNSKYCDQCGICLV